MLPGVRRSPPWLLHVGVLLAGWGGFNLVEGLVDHQLLGIHHVRDLPALSAASRVALGSHARRRPHGRRACETFRGLFSVLNRYTTPWPHRSIP
jgi:Predicted membrane protein (DUF2243)